MTQRGEWKFQYQGETLAAACSELVEHHAQRLDYWKGEYERLVEEAETTAVTLKVTRQQVTGGERAYVQADIDRSITERIDTAQKKVEEHGRLVDEYDRWRRGFEHNPAATFELDPDDIRYFDL